MILNIQVKICSFGVKQQSLTHFIITDKVSGAK